MPGIPDLDAYEGYLRYELNRRSLTVRFYLRDLREFAAFLSDCGMESYDPALVTLTDVRAWLGSLGEKGDSGATLRRKTQSLRAYFKYLMKRGVIKVNPAAGIAPAKLPRHLPEVVREEEMEAVLAGEAEGSDYDSLRTHLVLNLLYSTGMRRAELAALRDCDIDLKRLEIRVTGKRDKQRIVPIAPALAEEIEAFRRARDAEFGSPAPALILHKGAPLSTSKIYRIVTGALASAATGKKSPHVLRHSFATALLNDGAEINSVKELLGHASLESTQIYTHLSFADLKRNYDGAHPRSKK